MIFGFCFINSLQILNKSFEENASGDGQYDAFWNALKKVYDKQKINLPILCKDFFVDKFQVPLAKSYGADAILIILAGVSENLANDLYEEALRLNMSVIVEVHTVEEAKKALKYLSLIHISEPTRPY